MKHLLKVFLVFAFASTLLLSCGDDDDNNEPAKVPEITNLSGTSDLFNYTLSWTTFENAVKYDVYVDETKIKSCSETSISLIVSRANFEGDITAGMHSIKVDGLDTEDEVIASTIFDADIVEVTLVELKNLKGEQNTAVYSLTWDANETAKNYKLFVDDKEIKTCIENKTSLSVSHQTVEGDLSVGDHTIKIEGLDETGELIALAVIKASITEITVEVLENLSGKQEDADYNIVWDVNSNAKTYKVFVDNKETKTCTENKSSLIVSHDNIEGELSIGDHKIKVNGINETGIVIASANMDVSITEVPKLEIKNLKGIQNSDVFNIEWDNIENVSSYKLFIDGEFFREGLDEKAFYINTESTISAGDLSAGDHTFLFQGLDNAKTAIAEGSFNATIVKAVVSDTKPKNFRVEIGETCMYLYWDKVEGHTQYGLYINGKDVEELEKTSEAHMKIVSTENNLYKAELITCWQVGISTTLNLFVKLGDNKQGDAATIEYTPETVGAPTDLAVEVNEDGTCKLTWEAGDEHTTHYCIYNNNITVKEWVKGTEYIFTPEDTETCRFSVQARNGLLINSEDSNIVEVEVQAQIPGVEDIDYEFLQFTTAWRYALTWYYYKSNPKNYGADPESVIWFLIYEDDKEEPIRKLQIIGELQNDGRYKYMTTQLFYDSNTSVDHTYSIVVEDRITGAKSKPVAFKYYADDYQ